MFSIPYMKWKKKKVLKKCRKFKMSGQCYVEEENQIIFTKYWTNDSLADSVMRKRKNYLHFVFKSIVCVECWCEKEEIIFHFSFCIQTGISRWVLMWKEERIFIFNLAFSTFHSLYGVERKKFKKCDTNNAFLSWYEVKKIFHSIVGSNDIA